MKKKYIVELDDNEVLMKYEIEKGYMDDFYGRVVQMTNYVCNTPLCSEDYIEKWADAMIEDAVYSTLHDGTVRATYEVIASPIKTSSYVNGEYDEKFDMYLGKKVKEIVEKFCPSDKE